MSLTLVPFLGYLNWQKLRFSHWVKLKNLHPANSHPNVGVTLERTFNWAQTAVTLRGKDWLCLSLSEILVRNKLAFWGWYWVQSCGGVTHLCCHREWRWSQSPPTFWYRCRGTEASFPGRAAWNTWSCWRCKEMSTFTVHPDFLGDRLFHFNSWHENPAGNCLSRWHHPVQLAQHTCAQVSAETGRGHHHPHLGSLYFIFHSPSLPTYSQKAQELFKDGLN